MKNIVYATDFSENSKAALKYAHELRKKLGSTLTLLHVFEVPTIMNSPTESPTFYDIDKDVRDLSLNKLKDFYEVQLSESSETEGVSFIVKESTSTLPGIIDAVKDLNADLVVVGTKGKSKTSELLMGSTTKKLISESPCPVLCIPSGVEYKEIKKILYASDFDKADINALLELEKISTPFNAALSIIHVTTTDGEIATKTSSQFEEELQLSGIKANLIYGIPVVDNVYHHLIKYIDDNNIDLVVMLEREKNRIMEFLFQNDLVKRMQSKTSIPLLSFNKNNLRSRTETKEEVKSQTH